MKTLMGLSLAGVALLPLSVWAASTEYQDIERGRYISVLGDCAACHTADDSQPFSGGVALETLSARFWRLISRPTLIRGLVTGAMKTSRRP